MIWRVDIYSTGKINSEPHLSLRARAFLGTVPNFGWRQALTTAFLLHCFSGAAALLLCWTGDTTALSLQNSWRHRTSSSADKRCQREKTIYRRKQKIVSTTLTHQAPISTILEIPTWDSAAISTILTKKSGDFHDFGNGDFLNKNKSQISSSSPCFFLLKKLISW